MAFRLSGWFSFVFGKTLHQSTIYLWNILQHSSHTSGKGAVRLVTCYSNICACRKAIKLAIRYHTVVVSNPHYYFREKVSSYPQVGRSNPQGSGQRNASVLLAESSPCKVRRILLFVSLKGDNCKASLTVYGLTQCTNVKREEMLVDRWTSHLV